MATVLLMRVFFFFFFLRCACAFRDVQPKQNKEVLQFYSVINTSSDFVHGRHPKAKTN